MRELEVMFSVREDSSQWGTTEAAEERLRQDALADAEIRDRLNVTEFSKRAHARLDFLLCLIFWYFSMGSLAVLSLDTLGYQV
jgi:hypothetical protein